MERLLLPRIRAEHQRGHGPDGAFDACRIGGARTLTPTDEAVIGGELHNDIGYAAAIDQRARLDTLVGDAREEGLYFGNFHFQALSYLDTLSLASIARTAIESGKLMMK